MQWAALSERYWLKVDKRGPDDCWPWLGARAAEGYGRIRGNGISNVATHLALLYAGYPNPGGLFALHSCDNPWCVNPGHLRWGTQRENMADMQERGRSNKATGDRNGMRAHPESRLCGDKHWTRQKPDLVLRGDRHPSRQRPELRPRGEAHGGAKLTEALVREILNSPESQEKIARRLGLGQSTVSRIRRRLAWAHVR